eukprot:m.155545 g.155545  ORF g.155545 m.155545 type:complete len:160 (-) comp52913_c0_seq1:2733-3212(-)
MRWSSHIAMLSNLKERARCRWHAPRAMCMWMMTRLQSCQSQQTSLLGLASVGRLVGLLIFLSCREEDMLDLAALLKDNSRLGSSTFSFSAALLLLFLFAPTQALSRLAATAHLTRSLRVFVLLLKGCQIVLTKDLEGMTLTLPAITRNFYVDNHVPKPH